MNKHWIPDRMRPSARRRSRSYGHFHRYRTQKGYSLVTVTLVGLLMVLIVLVMLVRAQSDQAIARAQFLKSQSLVLADAAAVTYQSFLVHYPDVASFNSNKWPSFANAVSSDCALAGVLRPTDLQLINQIANQGSSWQAINPNNLSQGQLRLVNYQYVPDLGVEPNQAPGTGTLQVEGRARAKGAIAEAFGFGSSRSRVQLQFRVDPKPPEELSVGLIANQFSATVSATGKPAIRSNICDLGVGNTSDSLKAYMTKLANGEASKIAYSSKFEAPPPTDGENPLTGVGVYNLGSFVLRPNQVCQLPMLGSATTSDGLPQNCPFALSEMSDTDLLGRPVYKYNLSDLALGIDPALSTIPNSTLSLNLGSSPASTTGLGNARLILGRTGNEIIHLYVEGSAILKQSRISVFPGTRVYLYLHGSLDGSDPVPEGFLENTQNAEDLQVYLYPPAGGIAQNLNLTSGQGTTKAFIFAPSASLTLTDVKVEGAIWAKTVSVVGTAEVIQNVTNPTALKILIPGSKRIGPALNWQQREAAS